MLASTTTNTREASSFSTIQLYGAAKSPTTIIDDFRVDSKYVEWRTSETGEYIKYADNAHVALMKKTQGRCFNIKNERFDPRSGQPSYYNGGFTLKESSSDENHTIESA